ncbi:MULTISPECIES: LysR family transcriptional regulator [Microbacterium]|uniref:LysR family transcriptional regulator n=1 Tax=Microbacterium TaxID=33882 RepID=UPI000D659637|nr:MULTISPECIES: LysR family transcriptional regulator [Microbacterium]
MDPRRLRILLAVARTGSVVAAAEELFITPSAVSQQLKRLEREAGRPLVMRTPRGTVLTPAGVIAAEAAEEIERAVGTANARMREGAGPSGEVRLGAIASALRSIIVPRVAEWGERYPRLAIHLVEGDTQSLTRDLRRRELDLAVIELDTEVTEEQLPSGMIEQPLVDDPWRLVTPAAWMIDRASITTRRPPLPWLGVDAPIMELAIQRLGRITALESAPIHLYYDPATAVSMVAAGQGVAVLPALTLPGTDLSNVRVIDLPGLGTRSLVLRGFSSDAAPNSPVGAVVGAIRQAVASLDLRPE